MTRDHHTVARMRGAQRTRGNSENSEEWFDGVLPIVEDWHAKMCFARRHVQSMLMNIHDSRVVRKLSCACLSICACAVIVCCRNCPVPQLHYMKMVYVLVEWLKEDKISVIPSSQVVQPDPIPAESELPMKGLHFLAGKNEMLWFWRFQVNYSEKFLGFLFSQKKRVSHGKLSARIDLKVAMFVQLTGIAGYLLHFAQIILEALHLWLWESNQREWVKSKPAM